MSRKNITNKIKNVTKIIIDKIVTKKKCDETVRNKKIVTDKIKR